MGAFEFFKADFMKRTGDILPPPMRAGYGAKKPKMSSTRWVGSDANALTEPFLVGTIAMFEVIAPSTAFSVATTG
jgi:hypothetical protein